jgi:DNA modification methylase
MMLDENYLDRVVQADALEYLQALPDDSINCIVTSPPYFGLRDYGVDGQIGNEPTPQAYIAKLVALFQEARRVLRDDGTVFLNLGDGYVGATSDHKDSGSFGDSSCISKKTQAGIPTKGRSERNRRLQQAGLPMKSLMMIPARVAIALQDDGWVIRNEIVWHKPNPMPESVTDRFTRAHEMVYMFAKSTPPQFWTHRDQPYLEGYTNQRTKPAPDYRWLDNETGQETSIEPENRHDDKRWRRLNLWASHDYFFDGDAVKEPAQDWGERDRTNGKYHNEGTGLSPHTGLKGDRRAGKGRFEDDGIRKNMNVQNSFVVINETRNRRDVWTIPTASSSEAHFATFPEALITPMILAGCPVDGVVCDFFMGSGTTADTARRLGRHFSGCELNPAYLDIITRRLAVPYTLPMFERDVR